MLASVGTRDVARDLDVLRSALGEEKLNFLGYSYSTRLGATYAHLFPKNVRAMVLDGAFGPGKAQPSGARGQQQPPPSRSFQLEFEEFTRWCKERERCSVGSGPLTDLLRPLLTLPAQARDGRRLSYADAVTGIVHALYSQSRWEELDNALRDLRAGSGVSLLSLADEFHHRGPDGRYDNYQDVFEAVHCVDDPRRVDTGARAFQLHNPFLHDGRDAGTAHDRCAFWPVPPTGTPIPTIAPDGLPPVLVLSATNDPATRWRTRKDSVVVIYRRLEVSARDRDDHAEVALYPLPGCGLPAEPVDHTTDSEGGAEGAGDLVGDAAG